MGTEASLPALPSVRFGNRMMSIILLAGWVLLARAVWTNPEFSVRETLVEGAKLMSAAQVQSIAHLRGTHIFALDPQTVEQRLESYAEIDSADVHVKFPAEVTITIEERRPIVQWDDAGVTWWLSASGVAFIQRSEQAPLATIRSEEPILRITQDALEPAVDPAVLWNAVTLTERLPYASDLSFSLDRGLAFYDPRGWRVSFGGGVDMDIKIEVYESIATRLVESGAAIEYVSVEDPSSPYYKLTR
jgi:cell division protein FtsQ